MSHRLPAAATVVALVFLLSGVGQAATTRCAMSGVELDGHRVTDLVRWFGDGRKDEFTTADPAWLGCEGDRIAQHGGYRLMRFEGGIFPADAPQPPGTVPLHTWYSPSRQEHFTSTDPRWHGSPGAPLRGGYRYVRLEGFVYTPEGQPPPGTLPLYSWWSARRQDNLLTTDPRWNNQRRTRRQGYTRYRLEGYVIDPARTPNADPDALLPGCFVDTRQRDLPVQVPGDRHTPAQCRAACSQRGHAYAGIQFGGHCFCGDRFGRYGRMPMDQCQMPCRSDDRAKCGGDWRNLIERSDVPERPVIQVERPVPIPSRSWSGIDLPGADLRRIALPQDALPAVCSAACEAERACRAFTYVRAGVQARTPVCYLKDGVPTQRANDCCVSGVRITHEGRTRRSTTTHTVITPTGPAPTTRGECARACVEDPRCVSYSYDLRRRECSLGSSRIAARPQQDHISGVVPSTCRQYTVREDPAWLKFEHDSRARRTAAIEVSAPIQEGFDLTRADLLLPEGGRAVPMECTFVRSDLRCTATDGVDFCRLWQVAYRHGDPQRPRLMLHSAFDGGQCEPLILPLRPDFSQAAPNCTGRCPDEPFGIAPASGGGPHGEGASVWSIESDSQGGWRLGPSSVDVAGPGYITHVQLLATGGTLRQHYRELCTARRTGSARHTISCDATQVSRCDLHEHARQGGTLSLSVRYARPAGCASTKRYGVRIDPSVTRACEAPSAAPPSSGRPPPDEPVPSITPQRRVICRDVFERDGPPDGYAPYCATSWARCPSRGDFDRSHNAVRVERYTHKRSGETVKVDRSWRMPQGWSFVRYLDEPARCDGHRTPQSEWRRQ